MREKLEKMQDEINHAVEQYNDKTHVWATNQKAAFSTIECSLRLSMTLDDLVRPDITCKACLEILHKPQLFYPCSHTFCLKCLPQLKRYFNGQQMYVCPECSNRCSVDSVCSSQALNSLCSKYAWWQIPLSGMQQMQRRTSMAITSLAKATTDAPDMKSLLAGVDSAITAEMPLLEGDEEGEGDKDGDDSSSDDGEGGGEVPVVSIIDGDEVLVESSGE